jgi:hypothetical protein
MSTKSFIQVTFPPESVHFETLAGVTFGVDYLGVRQKVTIPAVAFQDAFGATSATAAELERVFEANKVRIHAVAARMVRAGDLHPIISGADLTREDSDTSKDD